MVMGLGYKRPAIVDYLCMTAGTCLMGIAIQSIYDPVGMVEEFRYGLRTWR